MTMQTKTIGRISTDHGPLVPGTVAGKRFQYQLFGCVWESLHDNNNTTPAVWDGGDVITPNLVDWKKVSGSYEAWLMNKDKPATTGTTGDYPYNGMGRVVLKKNMVDGENILTQDVFEDSDGNPLTNTVFVIKYDFTIGEDITVPANCVLEFDGGSISGNNTLTLTLTKTHLSGIVNILSDVTGTVGNNSIDITWFGCKSSLNWAAEDDCTERLQLCIDVANASQCAIFIPVGDFVVNNTVYLRTGTIMKGIHGYTFKTASRLCTGIQDDSYIMFQQKNSQGELDAIRHCTFEGITFCRDRTSAERAGGKGQGEGYGLAGTIFKGFTELRLLNCGCFGWGTILTAGAICFVDHTDFAYCDTIIRGVPNTGTSGNSSIYIENANIWACGNLVVSGYYGMDEIVFDNTWIEYAQSLYSGSIDTKLTNMVLHNVWFTNAGYTDPHLIILTGTVNANTPTFVFKNCSIKNKGQICKSVNSATSVSVTFDDCYITYGGDYSLETCNIFGNSILRDYTSEYIHISYAANSGINTHNGGINNALLFKKQSNSSNKGEYAVFRGADNIIRYYNENNKDVRILDAYGITGQAETVSDATQDVYLMMNTQPSWDDNILVLHNKGLNKSFVLADNIRKYGTTDQRPTRMINGNCYFDTTIGKPIWVVRDQYGVPRWVDATGTTV